MLEKFVAGKDVLAVAVSGGKDSTALLEIAHRWGRNKFFAVCVDEGTPGHREKPVAFLKDFCKERGIALHVFSFAEEFGSTLDEMLKRRPGGEPRACTVCGTLRRYLINKKARELGATKVLIAHNLDDELQTFLMNLFSGNLAQLSRKGELVGIIDHPLFVVRLKPLMNVPEKALATHALVSRPVPDVQCPYRHESARSGAREFLSGLEARRPGAKKNMMSLYMQEVLPALRPAGKELHQELRCCGVCGEPSSRPVCKACELKNSLCAD